jgi:hypothetical protein
MKNQLINQLDPSLLFQRGIALFNRLDIEEKSLFQFELCPYPTSIFQDAHLIRAADKAELAKAMQKAVIADASCVVELFKPSSSGIVTKLIIYSIS